MAPKRQLLLLSASAPYGYTYLQYARQDLEDLFNRNNVKEILFVPYALRDHNGYTEKVEKVMGEWGYKVKGLHTFEDPVKAINSAQTIFIGGGNTFQLIKGIYDNKLLEPIRKRVLKDGIPYIGSSAGTNIATINICTTNDMPIVQPPSFNALALVPFNINPHYLDTVENDKHQGETRDERISQYLEIPGTGPVLGLREGSTLCVDGDVITLKGISNAKVFGLGPPKDYEVGSDLSFLLTSKY